METEIFTCKYFKFGRNTTGLSQSHLRNFLACSITCDISYFCIRLVAVSLLLETSRGKTRKTERRSANEKRREVRPEVASSVLVVLNFIYPRDPYH